jgi:hypothetical protein
VTASGPPGLRPAAVTTPARPPGVSKETPPAVTFRHGAQVQINAKSRLSVTALVFAVILKVAAGTQSEMSPLALPLATPSPGPDICPQLPSNLPLLSSNCTHSGNCADFQCNLNLDLASVQLKLQLRPCGNESFRQPPYIFASVSADASDQNLFLLSSSYSCFFCVCAAVPDRHGGWNRQSKQ